MSNDNQPSQPVTEPIPKAIQKKMWWPFPFIWIVPIAAAALAGYFLYQHHQEQGLSITIQFSDGEGIKEGQTNLLVRGVMIGKVDSLELSPDHEHVLAHVKLSTADDFVARPDTQFWLVKPEVSLESIKGLNTLISGPYINVQLGAGKGAQTNTFVALGGPPAINQPGIKIVLHADQVGQLVVDSAVYYRGIQVGIVQDIRLSSDATDANVTIYVWDHYINLIRTKTVFWTIKGADIQGSIFSGLKVQLNSLRALIGGGITFATPEKDYGDFIEPGATFELHDQPEDKWLKWKPKIEMPDDKVEGKTHSKGNGLKLLSGMKKD
jgi:paraquat-inducible protein B